MSIRKRFRSGTHKGSTIKKKTVSLPTAFIQEAEHYAFFRELSFNDLVKQALTQFLEGEKQRRAGI